MKQKTISLLLALALALSLAGCKKEETVTAPAGVAVQVQTVEAQDIASENTVSGQVTADSETSVYVTSTAKCTAVYVQAGDTVKAGDVTWTPNGSGHGLSNADGTEDLVFMALIINS